VKREDTVESTDNWFRPADVCVAPDGSVFVADWYDPGVGGHGMGDITRGRIYRLAPKDSKYTVPKVDLKDKGILRALGSPALSVRYMAMAKLQDMKQDEAFKLLKPAIAQKEDAVLRARAIWQYARRAKFNKDREDELLAGILLEEKDDRFAQLALRVLKDFGGVTPATFHDEGFQLLMKGASSALRREALILLRDVDPVKTRPRILALMQQYDGKDRFYLASVGIAVGHQDEKRREAILADFDKHFKTWDDKVADLVWELRPPRMLPLLEKSLSDDKLSREQRARIVDILSVWPDKDAGEAMLKLLQSDPPAEVRDRVLVNLRLFLPGKWRGLRDSNALTRVLDGLLSKPQTRVAAIELIAAAGRTDRAKEIAKLASSKDEPAAVRKAAVTALGQMPSGDTSAALGELLKGGPADLRPEVTRALGELAKVPKGGPAAKSALKALQDIVTDDRADAGLRGSAVTALTAGRPGSIWLIDLKKKGKMDKALFAVAGRILRNSPYRDLQNQALLVFPLPGKLDPKNLPSPATLAKRTGDASKGKKLLADSFKSNLQCMKCHLVRGVGGQIGPDLSMIGKKASKENLHESILLPNKAIADQFLTWVITTDKGLFLSGLIVEETTDVVVVRDSEGRDTKLAKKSIEKREKSPKSLMPDDLLVHMSEDELVDIVEYLFSLKTPALAIDTWHIIGPFDNGSGMQGLDKVYPPEKGIDLKATYAGKNGKVSWKTVKSGPGGYLDLQTFFAPNSANIVSYLTCEIDSPAEQDATVLMGTDDGSKLWINDKLVHTSKVTRAAAPEQDSVKVKLKKGVNRIVLKINNGDGPHGFYFTVLSEQELKMAKK
jgi:putative heme-binding domain-containing protein